MNTKHRAVIAFARAAGFTDDVDMGGARFLKTLPNGDILAVNNGPCADFPATPDSYCEWGITTEAGDVVAYGKSPSFRTFVAVEKMLANLLDSAEYVA